MGIFFLAVALMGLTPGGIGSLMLLAFFIASIFDASKERPATEVWGAIGLTSILALLLPTAACFGGVLLFTTLKTILWIGDPHGQGMPNPIAVGIFCFVLGLSPGLAAVPSSILLLFLKKNKRHREKSKSRFRREDLSASTAENVARFGQIYA